MAIEITRQDCSTKDLRNMARRTRDVRAARRMLAIALVLEGASREVAARSCGMDRQTLRDWVHRYNEAGIEGLADKPRAGRPPQLGEAQLTELDAAIEEGPDIAVHKVVRWRCIDLANLIKDRFEVELSERHVGRLLKRRGYRRLSVRPRHPKSDESAQSTFKKTSARR